MTTTRSVRALWLFATLSLFFVAFFTLVRPWYLSWGATAEERRMPLPGDGIIPGARSQQTRAITITAPAPMVWPWIAQLGQDRGGFYSYDVLENLVGCEMPIVDVRQPFKQQWTLGDKLWMYPKEKHGGAGFATLREYVPGEALGFAARSFGTTRDQPEDGSWSMVLVPHGSSTRLLIRGRGAAGRSLLGTAFDRSIFEPIHFVMERRMMIGIKQLTETGSRGRISNHVSVVLWAITFGAFISAGVLVLRSRDWKRALAGFITAGVVFQVLTLAQPPAPVGLTLVWMVLALLWWPAPATETVSASASNALSPAERSRALQTPMASRL